MNYGFKATIPGKNVLQATALSDFALNTKYNPLKITRYGNTILNVPANNTATVDVVHGLNYSPMCMAYYDIDNNGRWWMPGGYLGQLSSLCTDMGSRDTISDKYKVQLGANTFVANPSAYTIPVRYILFDEPAVDTGGSVDKPVGYVPSNVGLKISKSGIDVRNSKLYEQIFNSNCDFLKFHSVKTVSMTFTNNANGNQNISIAHNLGYVPLFIVYGYFNNNVKERTLPWGVVPQPFASNAFADINNITIEIIWAGSGSPSTITFYAKVIIFKNNLFYN